MSDICVMERKKGEKWILLILFYATLSTFYQMLSGLKILRQVLCYKKNNGLVSSVVFILQPFPLYFIVGEFF